ncbi:MAG TPA: hypothetical protein VHG71_00280 [Verrucomicrobiae bacterium]|nr:hypothetical protein [Verrucomicrobiae bacterium]
MKLSAALSLVAILICSGCAHKYLSDDSLLDGNEPEVPTEFKTGAASLQQVKEWSASLLSDSKGDDLELVTNEDLNQDGTNDLLVANGKMAGTGGNNYLAFQRTSQGYAYLGHLGFGAIRVLPKDESHRQKILTWWHISSGEGGVTLLLLDKEGFHEVANATVYAGDQGTEEGNRIAAALFGTNNVSSETLERIFHKSF